MDAQTRKIIEWAIENADLTMYASAGDFKADDDWVGSAPGEVKGAQIHLIAQSETDCLYGETTDNINAASYLVGDACIISEGSARAAVEDLLNRLFGEQWPDNYAQTHGWFLP